MAPFEAMMSTFRLKCQAVMNLIESKSLSDEVCFVQEATPCTYGVSYTTS